LKAWRADLHVHTVLSPCAGVEMIPPLIVEEALERGINLIAITDHNATANIPAVQKAAEGTSVHVLAGMELQTREEVHTLCLFDRYEDAHELQAWVDLHLPAMQNNPEFFGEQYVVDETGDFIRSENRLLLNSVDASLTDAWNVVKDLGGLFIPAHINRKAFGLIPTLGIVPLDIPLEILEISRQISAEDAVTKFPQIRRYSLVQNGDVHFLDGFLGSNTFWMENPTTAEIRLAVLNQAGRSASIARL
jgi:PHP family Zn ribbon phosphoesterase